MAIILEQVTIEKTIDDILLTETVTKENILTIKLKDVLKENKNKTALLSTIEGIMAGTEGSEDKIERKIYFKAKKLYSQVVEILNKENDKK